ncbi:IS110 family transposase, partial [Acinetobacter baumannii]
DLTKNVFAIHGINAAGKVILVKPAVRRDQLLELLANLPPCIIGMEACSGAHHWARLLIPFGHTPKLMAPKFVIPYRIQGKHG